MAKATNRPSGVHDIPLAIAVRVVLVPGITLANNSTAPPPTRPIISRDGNSARKTKRSPSGVHAPCAVSPLSLLTRVTTPEAKSYIPMSWFAPAMTNEARFPSRVISGSRPATPSVATVRSRPSWSTASNSAFGTDAVPGT